MKLLIADDENIVLEGLKQVIDWTALGFDDCQTTDNGESALEHILRDQPDLVVLDIRMPRMDGIEVVAAAMEKGFSGKFIILSGYSEFKLAQSAMRYGVTHYLTKPIDEDELTRAVVELREQLLRERSEEASNIGYRNLARQAILGDLLLGTCDFDSLDTDGLQLKASSYQVISYEKYNNIADVQVWDFADLLHIANHNENSAESVELDGKRFILLKGTVAMRQFDHSLEYYRDIPQKGSPLDMVFIAYGFPVLKRFTPPTSTW